MSQSMMQSSPGLGSTSCQYHEQKHKICLHTIILCFQRTNNITDLSIQPGYSLIGISHLLILQAAVTDEGRSTSVSDYVRFYSMHQEVR